MRACSFASLQRLNLTGRRSDKKTSHKSSVGKFLDKE